MTEDLLTLVMTASLFGLSQAALAQDDIPAQYQTSDRPVFDVMNQQKAEMCSPPTADMEATCEQIEQGRQMLLARVRGDDSPPMRASATQSAPSQEQLGDMLRAQVDQICGRGGDEKTCAMARQNLNMATQLQPGRIASQAANAPSSRAGGLHKSAATQRPAAASNPSKPSSWGGSETFSELPPGVGSNKQREFWARTCKGKTFRLDSSEARACRQNYQVLTGQMNVNGVEVGHPTPPTGSATNVGHVTTSGGVGRQAGSSRGGTSEPLNPVTHQPCITSLGQTTKQYGEDTHYTIRFTNSCNITLRVEALADSQVPNDWRSNGLGPSTKRHRLRRWTRARSRRV